METQHACVCVCVCVWIIMYVFERALSFSLILAAAILRRCHVNILGAVSSV